VTVDQVVGVALDRPEVVADVRAAFASHELAASRSSLPRSSTMVSAVIDKCLVEPHRLTVSQLGTHVIATRAGDVPGPARAVAHRLRPAIWSWTACWQRSLRAVAFASLLPRLVPFDSRGSFFARAGG
jgi:hypothetical protein